MPIDTYVLAEQIRRIVEQETLTGKGLEAFQAAIAKVTELEKSIVAANERIGKQDEEIRLITMSRDRTASMLNAATARENAVAEREKNMTKLEREQAVAHAQSAVWEKACGLIFRNVTIRSQMHGVAPRAADANPNTYHSSEGVSVNEDVSKTAE